MKRLATAQAGEVAVDLACCVRVHEWEVGCALKASSEVLRLCVATDLRRECSRCTLKTVVSQAARQAVWRAVFCRACFVVQLHLRYVLRASAYKCSAT